MYSVYPIGMSASREHFHRPLDRMSREFHQTAFLKRSAKCCSPKPTGETGDGFTTALKELKLHEFLRDGEIPSPRENGNSKKTPY